MAWRNERREPVRYVSPIPRSRRDARAVAPRRTATAAASGPRRRRERVSCRATIELEPPHLASLTPEQRDDLRLWHGRVNLLDRVKAIRRYALATTRHVGARHGGLRLRRR